MRQSLAFPSGTSLADWALRRKIRQDHRWRLRFYRTLAARFRAHRSFMQTVGRLAARAAVKRPNAALTRLLGPDVIASPDMITLAELTREATAACRPGGRPLYAGHAGLDWPEAPHLVMWHALSLLREHRGDGHIGALVAAELPGLEALVTHTATGQGFVAGFAQASRGWSDEEWEGAVEALTARGLLGADGTLTPAGEALRAHVEEETDRLAAAPWQHLGDDRTEEVVRIGKAMTRAVMKAGAFPREGVFAR